MTGAASGGLRMKNVWILVCLAAALAFPVHAAPATGPSGYHLVRTVPLPGDEGWDDLALNQPSHRLFITHGTHVVVVNLSDFSIAGDIPGTPRVHGVAFAPGIGFTSNGGDNTVSVFDPSTFQTTNRIAVGTGPDAILYDPVSHDVLTFNGGSKDATVIDAKTQTVVGTIPLGGKPEFAASDGYGKVFVNIEDTSEIVAIDTKTLTIANRWPLAPCTEPSGLAIDIAHNRLFAVCHNKMMAVVDALTGKIVATPAIGEGPDGAGFDPGTQLAFSSNGEGTLTVVREISPNEFKAIDTVQTQKRARTMKLDTESHDVFLVTADFNPPTTPGVRPTVVPGTVRLLVYAK
jgi:YVTN family beta-propeller protein